MNEKCNWYVVFFTILAVLLAIFLYFKFFKTEAHAYSSDQHGFSMILPTDYEESNGVLSFGAYELIGEGAVGEKARLYTLTVIPARSVEAVIQFVKDDNFFPEFQYSAVVMDVGEVKAVQYRTDGLCDSPNFEIVGKTNNYRMGSLCQGKAEDMLKIIETMKVF